MRYKCLVFDHDDTVVNSTATIHYPCFVKYLALHYPERRCSLEEYFLKNFNPGFVQMCKDDFGMSEEDMDREVEFWSGNTEYDYEIDAVTGDILSYDFDVENYSIPSGSQASGNYISQERAREIAQDRVPTATLVELEFEFDDGRAVYEGKLREGRMEYEFEIDAVSGSILQWEQDWD